MILSSNSETPHRLTEEEVSNFVNSIRDRIVQHPEHTSKRIYATLLPKLTPKIMAMSTKWLLPNVIEEVLDNNESGTVVLDKKLQEVKETFPQNSCARELMFKMLVCGFENFCPNLQN